MTIDIKAQEVKILSFKRSTMDVSASTHPMFDANNEAGALVKVIFTEPNVKFEGNIIGTPEYKTNEHWVYLTAGTKFFVIKAPNAIPVKVLFADHQLSPAQSKMTYELVLSRNGQKKQTLTVSFSPPNASVMIDNRMYPSNNGKVAALLPVGKHDVTIAAIGYDSYVGTITLIESSPSNIQTTLSKSANVEETAIAQKDNATTVNNNTPTVNNTGNKTYSNDNQYVVDKIAEGKRLYGNKDYSAAYDCFQTAALAGNTEALNKLGDCHYFGRGVAQNYAEAMEWYQKAAELGDAEGQFNLGICFAMGRGVKQNYPEAIKWYRKAAEQGHGQAQTNLGVIYFHGADGVKKDYAEAVKWYKKAAELGYVAAQVNLGDCYRYGLGVVKNKSKALNWYKKAAEQGDQDAKKKLSTYSN